MIHVGDSVTEDNAAEGNEIEPEGGKESVEYRVELSVQPSLPLKVIGIDVDVIRPHRLKSICNILGSSCLHAGFVFILSLGFSNDAKVFLFVGFLYIILPVCWVNKVAFNFVAGTVGCSAFEQQNCAELAFVSIVELNFAFFHQFGHHLLFHGEKEKVIKVGDDDKSQEVHDDIHDGVVGREHGEVDHFDDNYHHHLSHSNPVSLSPVSELVVVAEGVLHAAKALLDLICEGYVENHCTQEPGKDDSLGTSRLLKTGKHIRIRQSFSSKEPEEQHLANYEEPVLSGVVGSISGIVFVELIKSLRFVKFFCCLLFLTFFVSSLFFFRYFSSRCLLTSFFDHFLFFLHLF